jgi:hypothetical protein
LLHSSSPKVPQPLPRSRTLAFFGSRAKWDNTMESVLKGNAPSHKLSVSPLGKVSIGASSFCRMVLLYNKKVACASYAQAISGVMKKN